MTAARNRGARDPHRVLFVETNEDGTVGGSHRSLFELATRLDADRYHPLVLFFQANRFVDLFREQDIPVRLSEEERRLERRRRTQGGAIRKTLEIVVGSIRRRMRFLKAEGIEIVHMNNSPWSGSDDWLPACHLLRIPIVVSARGGARADPSRTRRFLAGRFHRVICVSRWVRDALEEAGIPKDRLEVVYNGVDLEGIHRRIRRSNAEIRKELGVSPADLLVMMAGNLRPWKGQHVGVKALAILKSRGGRQIHLAFAGDTGDRHLEYERQLRATVKDQGLEGNVTFLGRRKDVPELFNAADVSLHASVEREPFGLVVVESMASGTPVIGSDRGGPAEIITPDSGFLHDPENPEELVAILHRLTEDREELLPPLRLGARQRSKAFDISKTVARVELIYEELLSNRHDAK